MFKSAKRAKRILFLCTRAPYGTIYALEALEALLATSAYEQQLSLAFIEDGVYQLQRGQNPSRLGMKQFAQTFAALPDFGVTKIYVNANSLNARGIATTDLIEVCDDSGANQLTVCHAEQLAQMMESQDIVLEF